MAEAHILQPAAVSSLREALDRAGWSPRALARAINEWLLRHGRRTDRIDITAPYSWVRSGYCPYGDMPEVVAAVLSERLNTHVSAAHLWPDHARARKIAAKTSDLTVARTLDGAVRALGELAGGAAQAAPVAGVDLVASVLDGLHADVAAALTPQPEAVHPLQAELIADHVRALRLLDDRQGGGALSLRYVTSELSIVLDLLRHSRYGEASGEQLLSSVADLAQLCGWMQFDAGHVAQAQSYLLLAVRVARAFSDDARAVNSVGMLSYVTATSGEGADAVQIIEAADRVHVPSRLLSASIAVRAATAYAAAGSLDACLRAGDRAQQFLSDSSKDDALPYLYYLSPHQLEAETGRGLLTLALRAESHRGQLLNQAIDHLAPLSASDSPGYQRSAMLHGCHLARAYVEKGDLDAAAETTRTALARLRDVQSGRCVGLLQDLRRRLAQRSRARPVAQLLPELDSALRAIGS